MNSPIAVRKLTTPMAIPLVSVGRIIEHRGSLRFMNEHGSGMIRFVWNSRTAERRRIQVGKSH